LENREPPDIPLAGGWLLHHYQVVNSTNLVAANLPAWHAVRADTQTAGRGRFQRKWVSDAGGLWLSAVVPVAADSSARLALPLAAGLAVCDASRALRVARLRLRWPNDVLVGGRKLAGLLVDQFAPGLAVVGVGINVANHPETHDPTLRNQTARLADLLSAPPSLDQLTALTLDHLRSVAGELLDGRLDHLLARVNALWGRPRRVELDLDGTPRRGTFIGVEADGRLILLNDQGSRETFHPSQVRHLAEEFEIDHE
jgi:BirA family biotin operon repressor/biotin-[acetyl-CoA-carboxylase] ligase